MFLKLDNNKKIIIEFDPAFHKIDSDLEREREILQVLDNIYILRVKEDYYLDNKDKVKKEMLNIILDIDNDKFKGYDSINSAYLPIHITNNI